MDRIAMKFKAIVCFLAILATSMVQADENPAKALSTKLQSIDTFKANFEQRLLDPQGKEIQVSRGKVIVKQPGLFHWEVQPPYEQLVVANQETLWVYDADLEQVTVSQRERLDNTPAQILSGDFSSLGDDYQVSKSQSKQGDSYRMQRLDQAQGSFTALEFRFNKKGVLTAMYLVDKLEQQTQVEFSQQRTNKPVDDKLFNFIPPEGTDIVQGDRP